MALLLRDSLLSVRIVAIDTLLYVKKYISPFQMTSIDFAAMLKQAKETKTETKHESSKERKRNVSLVELSEAEFDRLAKDGRLPAVPTDDTMNVENMPKLPEKLQSFVLPNTSIDRVVVGEIVCFFAAFVTVLQWKTF